MSANDAAVAAPAPDSPAPDFVIPPHAGLLKVLVVVATIMQVLDMTIANVALPHMRAALGADQDSISWVLTSYIVASAIALPACGWLADRIGQRKLYLYSIVCFVGASVLCGIATNLTEMVLFRVIQGISGAFLSPLAQTVLLDSTPPEKRGQAMAMFGMGVILGPVLGPILGAFLTENFNWRWVFFVNVPIGIVAFAGLATLLPDKKGTQRRFDITGFMLLAIALGGLQLMLDRGQTEDWFDSGEIVFELIVGVSALWIFGVHLATAKNPIYSREMLRNRNLVIGSFMMGVTGFVLTAAMTLMPIMLQGIFGYPVIDAGLLLAMRGLGVFITMLLIGRWMHRIDSRLLIGSGFLIVALCFWDMSHWSLDISWGQMALNGFIQGIGIGGLFVPITTAAFATLPAHLRTDGSGFTNLMRSMGSSIGISVVVTLLSRNTAESHAGIATHLTPFSLFLDPRLEALSTRTTEAGMAMLDGEVTRQAMMIGFLDDFVFMAIVAACVIPLAFLIGKGKKPDPDEPIHVME